ncbi:extracellular solute-binding protein [Dethiothermospora halolimnae]|uniref:extracellular solute-binding protein n=1 Tax=Dethiothermospora halolimnae TaxID=3114390 RepID=UPI003CCBC317
MKKVLLIILCIILLLVSCTNESNVDSISNEDKEIAIAIWEKDYYDGHIDDMPYFHDVCKYDDIKDIKVKFDIIKGDTYEEFLDNINVKLYLDKGPTLIYISYKPYYYQMFKEKGIAKKVDHNMIPNINNIYDFYLEEEIYFVPIGAYYICTSFNKAQIEKLDIEIPGFNLTINEYYDIRKKWVEYNAPIEISWSDVEDIVRIRLDNINIFSEDYKAINIDTKIMRESIKTMKKEIYSGKYILPNDFTYEDYYKACFDFSHQERSKYEEFRTKGMTAYYLTFSADNGLKTSSMKSGVIDNRVIFPNVEHPKYNVDLGGFIVNKNGKNKELGYKFLNRLLEEEFQMKMYEGQYMYAPVIKTVEDDIEKIESKQGLEPEIMELKNYIYDKMEKGEIQPRLYTNDRTLKTFNLRRKLYKDLFKFIFTEEEYSVEELSRKLKELEDRYSVYLNE